MRNQTKEKDSICETRLLCSFFVWRIFIHEDFSWIGVVMHCKNPDKRWLPLWESNNKDVVGLRIRLRSCVASGHGSRRLAFLFRSGEQKAREVAIYMYIVRVAESRVDTNMATTGIGQRVAGYMHTKLACYDSRPGDRACTLEKCHLSISIRVNECLCRIRDYFRYVP